MYLAEHLGEVLSDVLVQGIRGGESRLILHSRKRRIWTEVMGVSQGGRLRRRHGVKGRERGKEQKEGEKEKTIWGDMVRSCHGRHG